nr:unnamed protein product [Digitaria exilis]
MKAINDVFARAATPILIGTVGPSLFNSMGKEVWSPAAAIDARSVGMRWAQDMHDSWHGSA